jgi:hypothetical protein
MNWAPEPDEAVRQLSKSGKENTGQLNSSRRQSAKDSLIRARFSMTMIGAEWLPSGEGRKAHGFILMSLQRNDAQIGFRRGAWRAFAAELDD